MTDAAGRVEAWGVRVSEFCPQNTQVWGLKHELISEHSGMGVSKLSDLRILGYGVFRVQEVWGYLGDSETTIKKLKSARREDFRPPPLISQWRRNGGKSLRSEQPALHREPESPSSVSSCHLAWGQPGREGGLAETLGARCALTYL